MKGKVRQVLKGLSETTDLARVLEEAGISASGALGMLERTEGKKELEARRRLARLHVELLAHRYGALAMVKLCGLLDEKEKLEVRLKAALAVLGKMGEARNDDAEQPEGRGTETAEEQGDAEILRLVADLMEQKRRGDLET